MRRSSFAPNRGRRQPGVAISVAAAAFMLAPGFVGVSWADEAHETKTSTEHVEVAQYYSVEVPNRINMDQRGKTVNERWRPDYIPLGIRAGAFKIVPSLGIEEVFTDNVFSVDTGAHSDFITRFQPAVTAASTWSNHALNAYASANIARHREFSFEDYEDYTFGARGRLDILRSTNVRGRLEAQRRHESRASPDDAGGLKPTEYDVRISEIEGYHRLNRVNFTLGLGVASYDYENSSTRDRSDYETSLRVGYEVISNYEAFLRLTYNIRDYDAGTDGSGNDRDSDGYEAVAGIAIDFGGITFGDFYLGYRRQEYDAAIFNASGGPVIGADITWNVTPLTTVIGTISREIRETTVGDGMGSFASGSFYTKVGLTAQHELLRNLILEADLGYGNNDFKGIERTDDTLIAGLSANYLITRNFYLSGGYGYTNRNSDVAGGDYTENVVFLKLKAQY